MWLHALATCLPALVAPASGEVHVAKRPNHVAERPIHVAELRGIVHPLSTGYLIEAIDRADDENAALLVIEIDTPGGLVDSTQSLVQRMLAAKTPIVAYVAPSGARAASAGFLILIGADVAAMAPATNTGAAHPVDASGAADEDSIGMKKAENDLAAYARTLAEKRGRSIDLAESAVTESASFTESEALEKGLIDLVATDRADLLEKLHGRTVRRIDGMVVTLDTSGAVAEILPRSIVQRWLGPILRPELVLLLLGLGITGLYVEISHPGMIFPGVVGVLCLLLFALAFQYLPPSTVGLLLVALGIVLFVLELKITSYGLLTVGGSACLIAGLLLMYPRDVPALRVSLGFVLPLAVTLAGVMGFFVLLVTRAQGAPVATGVEGMTGEIGRALTDLSPDGKVHVHGETWDARSAAPIRRGDEVRIVAVEGLRLIVERNPHMETPH